MGLLTDARAWALLMGRDLEKAEVQPLAPEDRGRAVCVGRKGEERTLPLRVEEHPVSPETARRPRNEKRGDPHH